MSAGSRGLWREATGVCPSIAGSVSDASIEHSVFRTSAYGFSSSIEKSEAVAAWNLAAAESLPTFPGLVQHTAGANVGDDAGQRTPVVAVNTCEWSINVLLLSSLPHLLTAF